MHYPLKPYVRNVTGLHHNLETKILEYSCNVLDHLNKPGNMSFGLIEIFWNFIQKFCGSVYYMYFLFIILCARRQEFNFKAINKHHKWQKWSD